MSSSPYLRVREWTVRCGDPALHREALAAPAGVSKAAAAEHEQHENNDQQG
jgi:hypothetical protein